MSSDNETEKTSSKDVPFSEQIGGRLQAIRKLYGLSQRELARRAEMTNSTLSMIEQGKVSPSISSLEKILQAFPVSLQDFFSEKMDVLPPVFRANDFIQVEKGTVTSKIMPIRNTKLDSLSLTSQIFPKRSSTESHWMMNDGFLSGLVISGEIQLTLDGVEYSLKEGDGFHFSIHRSYFFKNENEDECRLVSFVFSEN